ncbi:SDR family NAD(P)-dependent oxidoreductase [Kitasatospora sp. NPDC057512]|uniref:SDR family NAD(P)-dependent oxidoreductase n=1 Tax=Kitasatospora sp. NPDC057512 TaxID=3346154 RepID=UPI0036CBF567
MDDTSPLHLFDVTGKVALITGATRGLGQAIAAGLARAGARVIVAGRSSEAADAVAGKLAVDGGSAVGVGLDVTREAEVEDVLSRAVREHGGLDIVVNNAGIIDRFPAEDYPAESWQRVIDTNLTGAFLVSRAAGRAMLRQGSGKIINIASVLAHSGGRNVVAYAASKGALVQLTRACAAEWAGRGVHVNAIAAGYFETDLTAGLRTDAQRSAGLLTRVPAGRWGRPEELVGTVLYLASEASSYVHGAVIEADGGWTAA